MIEALIQCLVGSLGASANHKKPSMPPLHPNTSDEGKRTDLLGDFSFKCRNGQQHVLDALSDWMGGREAVEIGLPPMSSLQKGQ